MYVSCIYDLPANAAQSGKAHFTQSETSLVVGFICLLK